MIPGDYVGRLVAENLEIVSRFLAAVQHESVEEALPLCDPQIEVTTIMGRLQNRDRSGHDGLSEVFARHVDFWAFLEVRVDEIVEHDRSWVLAHGSSRGRAKGSASELDYPWTMAFEIAQGRIARLGAYLSREEALDAIDAG
jgi:ketosteroid isomerase-like protein